MTHSMKLPPLECLTAVEAAARLGSFSAAGDELGVTHSAVSRRIQAVEAWLGMALFERGARGVALTPAGHRFTQTLDQAFGLIGRFAEQWRPGRAPRVVKLSAVPSMAQLWLLPRLRKLQGESDEIRIELLPEHRLTQLDGERADIAIRYGKGGWGDVQSWKLFDERLTPVAAPGLVDLDADDMYAQAIARLPLLHDSDTGLWRAWFEETPVRFRAKPADRRFEDYDMVLAAAAAGLGVALLRSPLADDYARRLGLVALTDRAIESPNANYVIVRADETRDHVLALVERLIAAEA